MGFKKTLQETLQKKEAKLKVVQAELKAKEEAEKSGSQATKELEDIKAKALKDAETIKGLQESLSSRADPEELEKLKQELEKSREQKKKQRDAALKFRDSLRKANSEKKSLSELTQTLKGQLETLKGQLEKSKEELARFKNLQGEFEAQGRKLRELQEAATSAKTNSIVWDSGAAEKALEEQKSATSRLQETVRSLREQVRKKKKYRLRGRSSETAKAHRG
eukprot:TRINITY_DN5682_c0_g1_i1.p1 TRINITY_DN5682_c0_g1~~TRINITY_DN5682_c0_g1_i1.p1  ORF type:complete len:221 (-),score=81.32 TRINITY_DN5682_c0_g1_i1:2-664(-)